MKNNVKPGDKMKSNRSGYVFDVLYEREFLFNVWRRST